MAEGAGRFAQLLKPQKDKKKNMEVDIAAFLEEYLEQLQDVVVSFDGGATTMNFSEAAMLIQSSACVYSKKVEYLFSLVTEMLDVLASKKVVECGQPDDGGGEDESGDGRDTRDKNRDSDERLPCRDDIKTRRRIKKRKKGSKNKASHQLMAVRTVDVACAVCKQPATNIPTLQCQNCLVNVHDSSCREHLADCDKGRPMPFEFLKRMQKTFTPKQKSDSGGNALVSERGEELASIEDFRSHSCSLYDPLYMLMVDLRYLPLVEILGQSAVARHERQGDGPDQGTGEEAEAGPGDDLADATHDASTGAADVEEAMEADDDGMPPLEVTMREQQAAAGGQPENVLDASLRRSERVKQAKEVVPPKEKMDPWKLLDPYEETEKPKPPSKKGAVYKLPPGLETKSKKRKRTPPVPTLEPLNTYIAKAFYSNAKKYPKNPLKVPTDLAFDTIFWKEYKRRREIMRQKAKQRSAAEKEAPRAEVEEEQEEERADNWDFPAAEGNDVEEAYEPLEDDRLMDAINEGLRSNQQLMDGMPHTDLDGSVIHDSYEDLLRKHVEQYFKSAENYVESTDLIRRVDEWQSKMVPSLREEEEREAFDIKTYGERIIDKLEPGKRVLFEQVVGGRPNYDVCRTFLTMLMLANTLNLEIYSTSDGYGLGNFTIQLLTKRRHFEELEEYQAPSEKT